MDLMFSLLSPIDLCLAFAVAMLAGVVKGMVGFAMPMILISGMSSFLSPEQALAGLILPTLATNGFQALRHGWRAAVESVQKYRRFLWIGGVFLIATTQLVRFLESSTFLIFLGLCVAGFAMVQLLGLRFRLRGRSPVVESVVAAVAGSVGGLSGVWGPPTVMYLTALDTAKDEQMRVQGVIYGLGALALVAGHTGSGILRAETVPFSAALILPALLGMSLGGRMQDRIDQQAFRRLTLVVLLVAGCNLLRRGLLA